MGTPFLGEMRIFSFIFAPKTWALCNGQQLPINQNQALFSLLGTMYGGNGQTTFALPDLRGRVPIHIGAGFIQGQAGGQEFHTVSQSEMPAHNHFLNASDTTADPTTGMVPAGKLMGMSTATIYRDALTNLKTWNPAAVSNTGGSQPHENRQPFLTLSMCIALTGIFPSQN